MSKRPFLFDGPILPPGFVFPRGYLDFARGAIGSDYEPWRFLFEDMAASLSYYGAMLQKYSSSPLVPFAMVDDQSGLYNEGWVVLACFDGGNTSGNPRVYVHDYAKPPKSSAELPSFNDFNAWLAYAEDESKRYKADRSS